MIPTPLNGLSEWEPRFELMASYPNWKMNSKASKVNVTAGHPSAIRVEVVSQGEIRNRICRSLSKTEITLHSSKLRHMEWM
jgi:hypothetical protein